MATPAVRDDLADLVPYDPDMRPVRVMLSANENNWGLPPRVAEEVGRRLAQVEINRYPDATCSRLRGLLADMWGVGARNVVVGNGGDELIFNLLLAFGGPGRVLVSCPPTFSAYALYAKLTMTPVRDVVRPEGFGIDERGLIEAARDAAIVVITSPNNPTGNLTSPEFVARLASQTGALVVVDEAYGEFAPAQASCIPLVATTPNLCVLKTLSKAYALAGARVGYVICSPAVADGLLAVRLPYSVSRYAQAAAEVVVEMRGEMLPAVRQAVEERGRLLGLLRALADDVRRARGARVETYPSQANFILVRFPEGAGLPSARQIHEELAGRSILVRDFSSTPGLAGCLRVSVGQPGENDELIAALRDILGVTRP